MIFLHIFSAEIPLLSMSYQQLLIQIRTRLIKVTFTLTGSAGQKFMRIHIRDTGSRAGAGTGLCLRIKTGFRDQLKLIIA